VSARRRVSLALPIVLVGALLAGAVRAAPDEVLHRLRFRIHVNLLEPAEGRDIAFWTERLRLSLEQANLALRGKQGLTDTPCCARIEPVDLDLELESFGRSGDGFDVVTSNVEYLRIRSLHGDGVYVVLSLEACGDGTGTQIVGCADINGNFMIVDVVDDDNGPNPPSFGVNLEYLGLTIAHERGHNAGLLHDEDGSCKLMEPKVGGGCLGANECESFLAKGNDLGGVCECMGEQPRDPSLPDGVACGEPESCGLCSGAVCGACEGDAGVGLIAVANPRLQVGGTPDYLVDMSALTGGWSWSLPLTGELSGLAYDSRRDVVYGVGPGVDPGVGPGDSVPHRLVALHPTSGHLIRERDLDCSGTTLDCEPVVALAYDAGADLLYGVLLGSEYLGQTQSCSDCVNILIAIDPDTGAVTRVGEPDYLDEEITGLAYDSEVQILYGASEDDLLAIDLTGCGDFAPCPFTVVAATGKPEAGLSIDPRNGRLHLTVNRIGDLTYRVIDPAAPPGFETGLVEPDFTVGISSVGMGGLAARPVPEPEARLLQLASLGVLAFAAFLDRRGRRRSRAGARLRAGRGFFALLAFAALLAGGSQVAGASSADEVLDAEAMVRAGYYEGLPEERARECSEACAGRLIEMLDDPSERRGHAKILRVLGFSRHAGAYEALASYLAREPEGKVTGAVYNARVEVLLALGHQAKRDPRALQLLLQRFDHPRPRPRWSAGPMGGELLGTAMQRGVMRGLALSGQPEAGARLRAILLQEEGDARVRSAERGRLRHAQAALELHGRVLREKEPRGLDGPGERP